MRLIVLLLICFAGAANAQMFTLKKLEASKDFKAVYSAQITELYSVMQPPDTAAAKMTTTSTLEISQEVLERKKNYFQSDCIVSSFCRSDSLTRPGRRPDTASNQKCQMIKLILQYDRQGNYAGPTVELRTNSIGISRDILCFYNTSKQLVYRLPGAANSTAWKTEETDTLKYVGFELIHKYPLEWTVKERLDTMGLKCVKLVYVSGPAPYYGVESGMKALGLETIHSGTAEVSGVIVLEEKTGRLVSKHETGEFKGAMNIKSPASETISPDYFSYSKSISLKSLTRTKRKKFLGIF
ncbi:MAG TPA: hypothetical protein VEC12_05830 [Bacteroidia bacterium]|nr:hypothetical protein [Bacteroidia bacterium]